MAACWPEIVLQTIIFAYFSSKCAAEMSVTLDFIAIENSLIVNMK